MIHGVKFLKDFRNFKKDDEILFKPGINLLVGDQGSGKSTLLTLIRDFGGKASKYEAEIAKETISMTVTPIPLIAFDFEKDNPRTKSQFSDNIVGEIGAMFSSHGQTNRVILRGLEKVEKTLVLMDEPDAALSIRSCHALVDIFAKCLERNCQIIASTHSPIVIQAFPECYSLEHRQWINTEAFVESQKHPLPKNNKK